MKKNVKTIFKFLALLLILIGILVLATTYGKYVIDKKDTKVQESSAFYFESDLASTSGRQYNLTWNGIDEKEINFNVFNYIDTLQNTKEDIKYTISAIATSNSNLVNLKVYNSSENEVSSSNELILNGDTNSKSGYTLKINKKSTIAEDTVINLKITITASSPYTKELTSNIKLTVKNEEEYEKDLFSQNDYVVLNLHTKEIKNNITIKYNNSKLTLDKSNKLVNSLTINTSGTTDTIVIPKNSLNNNESYEIIFIKTNSGDTINLGTEIIV